MKGNTNLRILVAPLDWGLGHATRCIPLIQYLIEKGCTVFIGAEGSQKSLLEKEFPAVKIIALKGYRINYSRSKRLFALKIIQQLPTIIHTIVKEHKWLNRLISSYSLDAVISDNRYGLYSSKIPSIFITHQLKIGVGNKLAENFIQFLNYRRINCFRECWVPDVEESSNMAGLLSHSAKKPLAPVKYLGGLSRFGIPSPSEIVYNFLAVISGPEPQRTLLEQKLMKDAKMYNGTGIIVRGLPGSNEKNTSINNIKVFNHLPAKEMEAAFKQSEIIISRSGYTTVMDILKLKKESILIPTPGQTEQEYLAVHLSEQLWAFSISQDAFNLLTALELARKFPYQIPSINMHSYKKIVDDFIIGVSSKSI